MLGAQVDGCTEINNYASAGGSTPSAGATTFSGDSYTNLTNCVFEGLNVKPGRRIRPRLSKSTTAWATTSSSSKSASPAPANETGGLTRTQIGYQTTTAVTAWWSTTTWAKSAE